MRHIPRYPITDLGAFPRGYKKNPMSEEAMEDEYTVDYENPPIVEIGIPPLRITMPITSKQRLQTSMLLSTGAIVLLIVGAGAYFGRKLVE